jgi:hypothetical protein
VHNCLQPGAYSPAADTGFDLRQSAHFQKRLAPGGGRFLTVSNFLFDQAIEVLSELFVEFAIET